jgi:predicted extracellular nuclease
MQSLEPLAARVAPASAGTELAQVCYMLWRIVAALASLCIPVAACAQGPPEIPIYAIQGAGHRSPFEGIAVQTTGVVTAVRANGFFLQDPEGDGDRTTSDAIFVFTGREPTFGVGDALRLTGPVSEFSYGDPSEGNLSVTELAFPAISRLSTGNALPSAAILGASGRVPPTQVIEDDHLSCFDPDLDGIDFYESLEGMRVQVDGAVAIAPTNRFGEIFALLDRGAGATGRNARGGITVRPDDFNPERIQVEAALPPQVETGDRLGSLTGVVGYSFGAYEVLATESFTSAAGGLTPERTGLVPTVEHLTVSSYNVQNLDPGDGWSRFVGIGSQIAEPLAGPDILALQEVQDASGPRDDGVTDAGETYRMLIDAVVSAGGPRYEFADVAPPDGRDGGQPGGNIRVGYLYNPERVQVVEGSTQRLLDGEGDDAFRSSRNPLQLIFRFNGHEVTLINNHLTSKSGSTPLFGSIQPPIDGGVERRNEQAQFLNDYVDDLIALEPDANVIVLGDLNALSFESPLSILSGDPLDPVLFNLAPSLLPPSELYSFNFDGNSQLLDHLLVSASLFHGAAPELDIVHLNTEFLDRASDHDPLVARFLLEIPEPRALALAAFGVTGVLACRRRGRPSMSRREVSARSGCPASSHARLPRASAASLKEAASSRVSRRESVSARAVDEACVAQDRPTGRSDRGLERLLLLAGRLQRHAAPSGGDEQEEARHHDCERARR